MLKFTPDDSKLESINFNEWADGGVFEVYTEPRLEIITKQHDDIYYGKLERSKKSKQELEASIKRGECLVSYGGNNYFGAISKVESESDIAKYTSLLDECGKTTYLNLTIDEPTAYMCL